jgi:hypothetical protein
MTNNLPERPLQPRETTDIPHWDLENWTACDKCNEIVHDDNMKKWQLGYICIDCYESMRICDGCRQEEAEKDSDYCINCDEGE